MSQRLAIAGVASVVAFVAAAIWLLDDLPDRLGRPTHLPSIGADVLYLDASAITHRGSGRVLVVRLNGPAELVPHHFAHDELDGPRTIEAWSKHLDAPIVFNAGQFDENLTHLGWLKQDGTWIVSDRKLQWMGLLLSGPVDGGAWARVADLEQADAAVERRYRHAVQSMMLVDDEQQLRVRDSDKTACRTVVAEDKRGRILIILTEGAVTLGDLARWLPAQKKLGIVRAMNLDGGIESQLVIKTPELQLAFYGQYGTGTTVFEAGPGTIKYPLPAVVAVRPVPSS